MQDDIQAVEITDEAFDAAWGDDSGSSAEVNNTEPETTADHSGEAEGATAQEQQNQPGEETPGEAATAKNEGLRFVAKHFEQTREFDWSKDKDEIIANVQKGMDYERIRNERDSLKAELPALREYKGFLEELAADSGVPVEKMVEDIRTSRLVERERNAGRVITDTAAREQIQREKAARDKDAQETAAEKAPAEKLNEKQALDVQSFVRTYPDVKPADIPQSVWDDVRGGTSLVTAYTKFENTQLRSQLEAMKQQEKTKDRSTGSRQSSGNTQKSAFDMAWDAADY